MNTIRKLLPDGDSHVAESDSFDERWEDSFWGSNCARLLSVKDKYDPNALFFVHHWAANAGAPTASPRFG